MGIHLAPPLSYASAPFGIGGREKDESNPLVLQYALLFCKWFVVLFNIGSPVCLVVQNQSGKAPRPGIAGRVLTTPEGAANGLPSPGLYLDIQFSLGDISRHITDGRWPWPKEIIMRNCAGFMK